MYATRILVITLSNIGDAIMSTPVLAALHAHYPEACIDLVCDVRSSALYKSCPYIGHLFERDKTHGWMGYLKLIVLLRQTRYDLIVDLRTDFLVHLLRAKQKFKKKSNVSTLHMHSVSKHMAAIRTLVGNRAANLELWANAQDQHIVDTQFPCAGRLLAVGLGANFSGKIWPLARYVAVANALSGQVDGVVLLGGSADRALAQQFSAQVRLPVYNACGNLSLPQSYALLKRCHFYLGNDSGLGHMAAAAGLPTLTLFGPGSPVRYLPWSRQAYFIQDPQQSIFGITVESVVEKLQALLIQAGRQ
ncbi:glycosyltransferase family 9 protein [Methylophilus aquaticus]|uniref:Glycosyltransferase family 9 protein n=1 Tax=Methylophilus aquaticus TaxID=1971610 RepID=A0ABT9JTP1_9PROT|nr:glycosyltransferase family 9 protein [Methylophilus aquaticus]MDP8567972.1 glycosyltransferase family 9 protein [Methylophilus aquaticus]